MAKKLKITWQDGSWNRDGDQPVATVELPMPGVNLHIVGETLNFQDSSNKILLAIPESRLISAVQVGSSDA